MEFSQQLTKVSGKTGTYLDQLTFHQVSSADIVVGKNGGKVAPQLVLQKGEYITCITGKHGRYLGGGITITTSTQRKHEFHGSLFHRCKDLFTFKADVGKQIIGLVAKDNKIVDCLQEAISFNQSNMAQSKGYTSKFIDDVEYSKTVGSKKVERLKNMDVFILDNTMRETTVGTLRGHTVKNKRQIYDIIKKCGFKHFIVESFNDQTRVGDLFLQELIEAKEDLSDAFAFSELWEVLSNGIPQPDIPIGLKKCKQFGIPNVMLEFDLMYYKINYVEFDMDKICKYFKDKVDWIRKNLSPKSLILINMRDFSHTMEAHPERIWHFVNFVSSLPEKERILGLAFEDLGKVLPEQLGSWTRTVKNEMERCGWNTGHLLFHQHEQWGVVHASNLEVLNQGATGMWAGVCSEGAAMGHADTCTAILNLIRLGNTKVQKQYNCQYLREAAIEVTKIVTGNPPPPRTPVFGRRALDLVFGFLFSDPTAQGGFNLADFLGIKPRIRISNMSNAEMILIKLEDVYGKKKEFNLYMARAMKDQMLANASAGRKEEYNSKVGLAKLFDDAGGKMTPDMQAVIIEHTNVSLHVEELIREIREQWDIFNGGGDKEHNGGTNPDLMSFHDFYNGFMAPYFGCYRCEDSQEGLRAMDVDCDGGVDWSEFQVFLIWAGREYPKSPDAQVLLDHAFRDGLIPAMADHVKKTREQK